MHPNISFIKFADVKLPMMVEIPGKGYVQFGEDNLYPNQLLEKLNKSSKHNGIVLGKVNYIIGNGISYKDNSEQELVPNKNETINDLLKKVATDIEIFGGVYLELHYNALGNVGAVYHIPYHKVRTNKDNTQYFIKDWTQSTRVQPEIVAAYNPAVKEGKQILFYKEYRPGLETYSYPGYIGALNWIEVDIELSKYHLSTIKNGMFSSKLINFNEGKPSPEEQQVVETKFKKKFTGSENAGGIVLSFSDDPAKAPTVLDLSNTDLDKHFDILNKTTEQQIFVGHQITSPILFGIKTEGQLGGRTEMRDSFEIFKTTYVNDKQRALEGLFTEISNLFGMQGEMVIAPIEPIGFEFSEATIKEFAPKAWILEKIGIDLSKYPEAAQPEMQPTGQPAQPLAPVNENLKNLTGRQWQGVNRIIRNFEKGRINKEQAKLLLKSSLGLSDEEINVMLSIDNEPMEFSAHENDELLIAQFQDFGQKRDDYVIIKSMPHHFKLDEIDLNLFEKNILILIKRDKRVTPEVISEVIGLSVEEVNAYLERLKSRMIIREVEVMVGEDKIKHRTIVNDILPKVNDEINKSEEKPDALNFKILYSYEVKPGLGPSIIKTSRDFCRRMVALSETKMWSRADIETMSQRLGYSVWDRKGGWYGDSKECRHQWVKNIVMLKNKK